MSCELTTRHTSLAAAMVVTQELSVEGTRRRRLVIAVGTGSTNTHARSDNVTVSVAVSSVAVVVRQLIRGNANAHVVFVPWKSPAKRGREDVC